MGCVIKQAHGIALNNRPSLSIWFSVKVSKAQLNLTLFYGSALC